VRYASLGNPAPPAQPGPSATGHVVWQARADCLDGRLRAVVAEIAGRFGPVRVGSTCRSRSANRRSRGASRSHRLTGIAIDFRVFASTGAVQSYLARHPSVGGLKHDGGGVFHVDTGPRRRF
jgi:uncharacterized protein YcbK (DUF882 family)